MGVSENVVYPIVPNGFADHYPVFKWLFHWEYTQHFQTNPYIIRKLSRNSSRKTRHVTMEASEVATTHPGCISFMFGHMVFNMVFNLV